MSGGTGAVQAEKVQDTQFSAYLLYPYLKWDLCAWS